MFFPIGVADVSCPRVRTCAPEFMPGYVVCFKGSSLDRNNLRALNRKRWNNTRVTPMSASVDAFLINWVAEPPSASHGKRVARSANCSTIIQSPTHFTTLLPFFFFFFFLRRDKCRFLNKTRTKQI